MFGRKSDKKIATQESHTLNMYLSELRLIFVTQYVDQWYENAQKSNLVKKIYCKGHWLLEMKRRVLVNGT
jgi:hypothetical protein